jgi:LysM repeat protein
LRFCDASRWAHRAGLVWGLVLLAFSLASILLVGSVAAGDLVDSNASTSSVTVQTFLPLFLGCGPVPGSPPVIVQPRGQTATYVPSDSDGGDEATVVPTPEVGAVAAIPTATPTPKNGVGERIGTGSGQLASSAPLDALVWTPDSATVVPTLIALPPTATPFDIQPEGQQALRPLNLGIVTYTVEKGDTVSGLAKQYGVKQTTIIWANAALQRDPELLSIGQELLIPPIDCVVHTIVAGDTLSGIAKKYGADQNDILYCYFNDVDDPDMLSIGDRLLVPGGKPPALQPSRFIPATSAKRPDGAPAGSGNLVWPVRGSITQRFKPGHRAIDIGGPVGKAVVAVDTGYVIKAGWDNSGYGNAVLIDHGNGMVTLYAHLDTLEVEVGSSVEAGQIVGTLGKTGRATGPHLHLEIVINGIRQNPIDLLP